MAGRYSALVMRFAGLGCSVRALLNYCSLRVHTARRDPEFIAYIGSLIITAPQPARLSLQQKK